MLIGLFIIISLIVSVELFFMGIIMGFFQKQFFINDSLRFLSAAAITTVLLVLGYLLGDFSTQFLNYYTQWYAATVLFLLGLKMFYNAVKLQHTKQFFNPLDNKGLIFLSVLSGLNAFFIGLVFGLLQIRYMFITSTFFIFLLAILLGYFFGFSRKKLPSFKIEFVYGLLYILIAIFIVIYT